MIRILTVTLLVILMTGCAVRPWVNTDEWYVQGMMVKYRF